METIKYKDFAKLDLRTATIEGVEDIPGADKLYKLTVNLGKNKRTIVAGMKHYYTKADLHGKQIVIIANLEPRRLKGIESQGMLLAAQDEKIVSVLTPSRKVENGSKVM